MSKSMMEIIECPNVEGIGTNEFEGTVSDKCYICDDPVRRPALAPKRTKAFCSECYRGYLAMIRKKGGEVHERRLRFPSHTGSIQ